MSNKQQTAIDWLIEKIKEADKNGYSIQLSKLNEWHQQAKEMEKEQITYAHSHNRCIDNQTYECSVKALENAKQYYNETYGE